ncbi:MAG: SDR family NAD(P)-dependent oxidoreductase [Albidovulum sp.]|nr:SDR family NAD(P)-dependent oxidoreductase [Albidovulum sp.]
MKPLQTSQAFHSPLVEPALDDLENLFEGVAIAPPSLSTLVSNVTGRLVASDQILGGGYWRRHAREAVAFDRSVRSLANLGVDLAVEVGPHAVLGPMLSFAWPGSEEYADALASDIAPPLVLSSLNRPPKDKNEKPIPGFAEAVAGAYEAGLAVRFEGLFAGEERRRVALPGYPFQRERYWIEAPKRRRRGAGHPLLGDRHESASGEIAFETEASPSDPAWLNDHRVFGRIIAPGALYGAMMASASLSEGSGSLAVEDFQLHNPLFFAEDPEQVGGDGGRRKLQVLVESVGGEPSRPVRVFSSGEDEEGWTLHAECRIPTRAHAPQASKRADLEVLKAELSPVDTATLYRSKENAGIELGPYFRTLGKVWSGSGEALGEVSLPEVLGSNGLELHPLLLDGCFQIMAAARGAVDPDDSATYLPFGWERLWLADRLPDRFVCHVRMRENAASRKAASDTAGNPEVFSGDYRIYDPSGALIGELSGYTVKLAARAALLSAVESVNELLYEVVWRDSVLAPGMPRADFLTSPATVAERASSFAEYLAAEGVGAEGRAGLLADLERLSRSYAFSTLEKLGWERRTGAAVNPEGLRRRLKVIENHRLLFNRLLLMLEDAEILEAMPDGGFVVKAGAGDSLPDESLTNPDELAARLGDKHPHGSYELGMLRRCGGALTDVLLGREDPLALQFGADASGATDLYSSAPAARASNRMLGDAVNTLLERIPTERRLRVLEVGAGTGSATAIVLPELPAGRFDYVFTDISAGFFTEAESKFGGDDASMEYRVLDIEKDPVKQGFDFRGYDLVIASNVLHATRDLAETLAHCRELLAPSGQLVALEGLRGRAWQDLVFGLLEGWWRFDDSYRTDRAMIGPSAWRRVLADSGFGEVEILGSDENERVGPLGSGVILSQGPTGVDEAAGTWILVPDNGCVATDLATELAARNQTVVVTDCAKSGRIEPASEDSGFILASADIECRDSWRSLLEGLPGKAPIRGIVHLGALDGCGPNAPTEKIAEDVKRTASSALALAQGLIDADASPEKGVWFLTRGAQVLQRERTGELAGATQWGIGMVMARETSHFLTRMIDLDPEGIASAPDLVNELLHPDRENRIAYRDGIRRVARLVRTGFGVKRLSLPNGCGWRLEPGQTGALDALQAVSVHPQPLEPEHVRIKLEAGGLNFRDVLRATGILDSGLLGREFCGRILEIGSEVSTVSAGDRVVGLGFGTFGPEFVTHVDLVAPAPSGMEPAALATIPTAFATAAMAFDLAQLKAGERVLIHAGAGGVGLAAIQLAQAAGATVFATASAAKQSFLHSAGVSRVLDSRTTRFGEDILKLTGRAGVDVVLNSLTGVGFIEASLSCLANGGRFVELARVGALSKEEMSAARPDVNYSILELDALKEMRPKEPGEALRNVMERVALGELTPIVRTKWPIAETVAAMDFMRSARHIGKIVLTMPPAASGRLRDDRAYLITGGFGGIGCALAGWLADCGAGAIILNGRRPPDRRAEEVIEALRARGVTVRAELADVTEAAAVDGMLARIEREVLPLGGVVHSVGVLSDASLSNQSWERFERVAWPKVLGAWSLHKATMHRDLDMFVLFSSVAGVFGNPGQANHAAANAFLDQLAAHRRSLGLPGQAIAWGAWSDVGEAAERRELIEEQLAARGVRWIAPHQGLKAFERLVREDIANSVVAAVDWPVFGESLGSRPSFFADLLSVASASETDSPELKDDPIALLETTPAGERENLLVAFLQQELQAVLRLANSPSTTVGFFDLGMDSLMAVELRKRLNRAFAGRYAASNTVVFDYPNIGALARHLAEKLGDADPAPAPMAKPERRLSPPARSDDDGVAIVGMACRFPGAPDIAAYWDQLKNGRDAVTNVRLGGGPWTGVAGNPSADHRAWERGGFVEGIDCFDARFFGMTPIGARMMDPQQRLLLETSWRALEDAGVDPESLRGSCGGIYAGIATSEYRDLMMMAGDDGLNYLGTASSMAVGGVAFKLGLTGPAMPVMLNCAASLVSIQHAVADLRKREVDLALAGGANAILSPRLTREMAELGMLSRRGRCKTFDASADGFVRSEGCGMIILKRLEDAEASCDRIWAVIRGAAVNQNGASAGPTVPNGPAQERVIERALSQAGIHASQVDYLEAHGAGSELGDPIELQAAAAVYGAGRDIDRPLLVGSVKTNIGHLESAAGIAGLIKVVLAMRHGVIPKHLHFSDPSPHLDWNRLPVKVVSESTDWPRDPDRQPLAGISAFGISGTNAHVVLEGFGRPSNLSPSPNGNSQEVTVSLPDAVAGLPRSRDEPSARGTRLLPLSGKSQAALRKLAARYLAWLDERESELASDGIASGPLLSDMAWTASVGRSHFEHRAGVVFENRKSLREGLRELAEAGGSRAAGSAAKIAFVYVGGGIDWVGKGRALYSSEPVARAVLDRCDAAMGEIRGASLLDMMFDRSGSKGLTGQPRWERPATYALGCALTALWSSVGVSPDVALGHGPGRLAAAQAAGVFRLDDGLRLAAAPDDTREVLDGIALSSPSLTLVDIASGRAVAPGANLDAAYWSRLATSEPEQFKIYGAALAELGVDLIVSVGPEAASEATLTAVLPYGLGNCVEPASPSDREESIKSCPNGGFAEAVAKAYEAGLALSFAGLFAGESRSRISVPDYPFERRRHWIRIPEKLAATRA